MERKTIFMVLALLAMAPFSAVAQGDDLAYMPREAPAYTADDATIRFMDTPEPGIVDLSLPRGTYQVDLLNANGKVVDRLDPQRAARMDLRTLRAGTWTLRAHSPNGMHIRRFVVLGRGGTMWVNQPAVPAKRR